MLAKNPKERPSVDQILGYRSIKPLFGKFKDQIIAFEKKPRKPPELIFSNSKSPEKQENDHPKSPKKQKNDHPKSPEKQKNDDSKLPKNEDDDSKAHKNDEYENQLIIIEPVKLDDAGFDIQFEDASDNEANGSEIDNLIAQALKVMDFNSEDSIKFDDKDEFKW